MSSFCGQSLWEEVPLRQPCNPLWVGWGGGASYKSRNRQRSCSNTLPNGNVKFFQEGHPSEWCLGIKSCAKHNSVSGLLTPDGCHLENDHKAQWLLQINNEKGKKKKDLRAELNHCLVTAYKHIGGVAVYSFSQPDPLALKAHMQNIQTSLNHLLTEWVIFKTKPFDFQTTFGQTCGNEEKLLPENWAFMQCTWFATASMGSWVNINSNSPWQKGSLKGSLAACKEQVAGACSWLGSLNGMEVNCCVWRFLHRQALINAMSPESSMDPI